MISPKIVLIQKFSCHTIKRVTSSSARPWLLRRLADSDPGQVRQGLLRVIALAGLMQIVPAHDLNAYDGLPHLPARLAPAPAPEAVERPL
jgi:hypothetical protein